MPAATIEAYIENGQIKLPPNTHLPDHGPIFIIIPDAAHPPTSRIYSPKLVNPADAAYLRKTMVEERA